VERSGRGIFWRAVFSVSWGAQENLRKIRLPTIKHDQMLFKPKLDSVSLNSKQNTEKN
jgi:hypothetical protein